MTNIPLPAPVYNTLHPRRHSLTELKNMARIERKMFIDGILPIGLTLFFGRPKVGKSTFILNMCMKIVRGDKFLQCFETEKVKVAYFSLEADETEIRNMVDDIEDSPEDVDLILDYEYRTLDDEGMGALELDIIHNPEIKIWIFDTYQLIKPMDKNRNKDAYASDYDFLKKLRIMATNHGIAIILIHHSKKGSSGDEIDEAALGSTALTGAPTCLMQLKEDKDDKEMTIFRVRGRHGVIKRELQIKYNMPNNNYYVMLDSEPKETSDNTLPDAIMSLLHDNQEQSYTPQEMKTLLRDEGEIRRYNRALQKLFKRGRVRSLADRKWQYK